MAHKLPSQYEVLVGNRGRLVLPSELRRRLGIRQSDRMMLTLEQDGSLRLVSLRDRVKQLHGIYRTRLKGPSLADELIRDRRREAGRESGD